MDVDEETMTEPCEFVEDTTTTDVGGGGGPLEETGAVITVFRDVVIVDPAGLVVTYVIADVDDAGGGGGGAGTVVELVTIETMPFVPVVVIVVIETERGTVV